MAMEHSKTSRKKGSSFEQWYEKISKKRFVYGSLPDVAIIAKFIQKNKPSFSVGLFTV
jgi:hypothetical protein